MISDTSAFVCKSEQYPAHLIWFRQRRYLIQMWVQAFPHEPCPKYEDGGMKGTLSQHLQQLCSLPCSFVMDPSISLVLDSFSSQTSPTIASSRFSQLPKYLSLLQLYQHGHTVFSSSLARR